MPPGHLQFDETSRRLGLRQGASWNGYSSSPGRRLSGFWVKATCTLECAAVEGTMGHGAGSPPHLDVNPWGVVTTKFIRVRASGETGVRGRVDA